MGFEQVLLSTVCLAWIMSWAAPQRGSPARGRGASLPRIGLVLCKALQVSRVRIKLEG
jgi:hypothetical protein